MCQDETRVGLKTLTGKVITASGVKPTVDVKIDAIAILQ
ncbi:hypothetical protein RintRC_2682 [Richelia intracellularis]|nr:hypothetical protein RintRC_2682 [Richelia intracellularis]